MSKTYKYRISATVTKPEGVQVDATLYEAVRFDGIEEAARSAKSWMSTIERFRSPTVSYSDIRLVMESETG